MSIEYVVAASVISTLSTIVVMLISFNNMRRNYALDIKEETEALMAIKGTLDKVSDNVAITRADVEGLRVEVVGMGAKIGVLEYRVGMTEKDINALLGRKNGHSYNPDLGGRG